MRTGYISRQLIRGVICLTSILFATFALPGLALGDDGASSMVTAPVTREFTYLASEGAPDIPDTWTESTGFTYHLTSETTAPVDGYIPDHQTFSRSFTTTVGPDQPYDSSEILPSSLQVDEGEFSGEIPLTSWSSTPLLQTQTRQVDRTMIVEGLPSNDVIQIPAEAEFTISSDEYPGATTTGSLSMAGVSFEVAGTDASGIPDSFTATVLYRGVERSLEVTGYEVSGEYSGDVYASEQMMSTRAVYEPDMAVAKAEAVTPEAIGDETVEFVPFYLTKIFRISLLLGLGSVTAFIAVAVALKVRKRSLSTQEGTTHV